jgi:hypothetical protein
MYGPKKEEYFAVVQAMYSNSRTQDLHSSKRILIDLIGFSNSSIDWPYFLKNNAPRDLE